MAEPFTSQQIERYRNAGALELPKEQCPEGWYYCKELGCVSPGLMEQMYPGLKYVARNDITGGGGKRRPRTKQTAKRTTKRSAKKQRSGKRKSIKRKSTVGGSKKRAKTSRRRSRRQ